MLCSQRAILSEYGDHVCGYEECSRGCQHCLSFHFRCCRNACDIYESSSHRPDVTCDPLFSPSASHLHTVAYYMLLLAHVHIPDVMTTMSLALPLSVPPTLASGGLLPLRVRAATLSIHTTAPTTDRLSPWPTTSSATCRGMSSRKR